MNINILTGVYVTCLVTYFLLANFALSWTNKHLMEFVIGNILFVALFVVVYSRINGHVSLDKLMMLAIIYVNWSFLTRMATNLANSVETQYEEETDQWLSRN